MEIKSRSVVHGGQILRITHQSTSTKTPMTFAIYLPHIEQDFSNKYSYPALFYLSGLTCTDENVCHKANPFRKLAQEKVNFSILTFQSNYNLIILHFFRLLLLLQILLHVVLTFLVILILTILVLVLVFI